MRIWRAKTRKTLSTVTKEVFMGYLSSKYQPIRRCSCGCCRAGLHRGMGFLVKKGWRSMRRKVKQGLKRGMEEERVMAGIGYTD